MSDRFSWIFERQQRVDSRYSNTLPERRKVGYSGRSNVQIPGFH